jgi:Ca2+-binding RTX toxin-like protein
LIGDYNTNGVTDAGEETIYYSLDEALKILNASTLTQNQDARYILDRHLVATWLNYLAGNPIDDGNPATTHDPKFYIDQAIDWLQVLTDDENSAFLLGVQGDGYLKGLGDPDLDANSPVVPSSSPYWNVGINTDNFPTTNPYLYNTGDSGALPILAGVDIKNHLEEYNTFGTITASPTVFYSWDGDALTKTGTSANETLMGGAAGDTLDGKAGQDTIIAGPGNDKLTGGLGNDILSGGSGNDTFDINSILESGVGPGNRDVITDFRSAADIGAENDVIDLATIDAIQQSGTGNQAFGFGGNTVGGRQ